MNDTPTPPAIPAASRPKTGLATASLTLGVLSLVCLGLFAGIPAVILGVIARIKASKAPDQFGGGGRAMAGIITGACSFFATAILAALLLPALAKAKERAQSINCMNNLKQVGLAMRMYSSDHKDKFPKTYLEISSELGSPTVLICPADGHHTAAADWGSFTEANASYELLMPGANQKDTEGEVIATCPVHGHQLMGDGSVQGGRGRRRRGANGL